MPAKLKHSISSPNWNDQTYIMGSSSSESIFPPTTSQLPIPTFPSLYRNPINHPTPNPYINPDPMLVTPLGYLIYPQLHGGSGHPGQYPPWNATHQNDIQYLEPSQIPPSGQWNRPPVFRPALIRPPPSTLSDSISRSGMMDTSKSRRTFFLENPTSAGIPGGMEALELGVYVHPDWEGIVPPSESKSHPSVFAHVNIKKVTQEVTLSGDVNGDSSVEVETSGEVTPDVECLEAFPPLGSSGGGQKQVMKGTAGSSSMAPSPGGDKVVKGKKRLSNHKLDRYAAAYYPAWLRDLPPAQRVAKLPFTQPFPSENYSSEVISHKQLSQPKPFLHPTTSLLALPAFKPSRKGTMPHLDSKKAPDDPAYYSDQFISLLSLVLSSQIEQMNKATLLNVPLHLAPSANTMGGPPTVRTYRLQIPGIREDSPHLNIGDILVLRGLFAEHKLAHTVAIEAEVVGLVKGKGWVFVRSPGLEGYFSSLPKSWEKGIGVQDENEERKEELCARFQVTFKVASAPLCTMQDAVRTFAMALAAPTNAMSVIRNTATRWLFPEYVDVLFSNPVSPPSCLRWIDKALNTEQKAAIKAIIAHRQRNIPYLISGPPGTGKTKTLVEAVLQLYHTDPHACILVCAPSNPAADTLAKRLAKSLEVGEMFRLNNPKRTFAEVPAEILPYCSIKDDQFSLPPFAALMRFRVVVTGCVDAGILVNARATNSELMRAELNLYDTLHPYGVKPGVTRHISPHWTHLFIDEAGQGSEPETLIPMSVVLPLPIVGDIQSEEPMLVLCGDIHQLGPVIHSEKAREGELDVSLLERLFSSPVYADHPDARRNLVRPLQTKDRAYEPPFTDLVRNYRSIAPILMVPAALFYEDSLIPSAKDVNLIRWSELPNPRIPILFQGCETEEDWIEEGASWHNPGEVVKIVDTVRSLFSENPGIRPKDIAVITPWREQVWRARAALRSAGFGDVDVGNVETYQGGEFRVTIISCVRSRGRFLADDKKNNMGLFNERKRFNVAITRAKELLVVVGNGRLLKGDPFWNGFLQIALRNNLYKGPHLDMEQTGAYLSRLESQSRSGDNDDVISLDDAGMLLVGSIVRETLRE